MADLFQETGLKFETPRTKLVTVFDIAPTFPDVFVTSVQLEYWYTNAHTGIPFHQLTNDIPYFYSIIRDRYQVVTRTNWIAL